ncbi:abortive infection family protein [Micromonospora wenchangensis]|uniref:abortive infection family protein n=1 Tax=Micromonospora wenchangensis TaxID=1185415 RepID=UPI003D71B8D6
MTVGDDEWWSESEPPDPEDLLERVDRMAALLVQTGRAYGDDSWQRFDREYQRGVKNLDADLRRLGLRSPFVVWPSLASWHGSAKQHGSYAKRDAYVNERLSQIREQLRKRIDDIIAGDPEAQLHHLGDTADRAIREPAAVRQQLVRLERALGSDPGQAIGAAKNLVESTAKVVLDARGLEVPRSATLPALIAAALQALDAHPANEERRPVRDIVSKAAAIANHVGELRNEAGDGHGPLALPTGLELRHGRLAARVAVAWCAFVLETLEEQDRREA